MKMFHIVKETGWAHGLVSRVLIQHAAVSELISQHEEKVTTIEPEKLIIKII